MRSFSYAWSLPGSRNKDGGRTIRSAVSENPVLRANFTAVFVIEPELLSMKVLQCGIFDLFASVTLTLTG